MLSLISLNNNINSKLSPHMGKIAILSSLVAAVAIGLIVNSEALLSMSPAAGYLVNTIAVLFIVDAVRYTLLFYKKSNTISSLPNTSSIAQSSTSGPQKSEITTPYLPTDSEMEDLAQMFEQLNNTGELLDFQSPLIQNLSKKLRFSSDHPNLLGELQEVLRFYSSKLDKINRLEKALQKYFYYSRYIKLKAELENYKPVGCSTDNVEGPWLCFKSITARTLTVGYTSESTFKDALAIFFNAFGDIPKTMVFQGKSIPCMSEEVLSKPLSTFVNGATIHYSMLT